MRSYWITTHWPPEIGTSLDYAVYLCDGDQSVGSDMEPGDRVWIYQSKGGRLVVRRRPDGSEYLAKRKSGREGVIALVGVTGPLRDIGGQPERYNDDTRGWWRWKADTRLINQSGFVPRRELNVLVGYQPNYGFRGFGQKKSGLKQIHESLHEVILQEFNRNQRPETLPLKKKSNFHRHVGHGKGGEGPVHKKLKQKVAADPAGMLREEGLTLIQMEYPFPTGDRADVVLRDSENRYVAVEIETAVDITDLSGVLQAIKYSRMYAIECRRRFEEVRAFLVAHQISDSVKDLCCQYDIETFVIDDTCEKGL